MPTAACERGKSVNFLSTPGVLIAEAMFGCDEEPWSEEEVVRRYVAVGGEGVEMTDMEAYWAQSMVPGCNGYNARCFVFDKEPDLKELEKSFEEALKVWPALAGRWNGKKIVLKGGALFVVKRAAARAPDDRNDMAMLRRLAEYPSRGDVANGRGPLCTVRVTIFDDATIVAFAASHSVADGATSWNFIDAWTNKSRKPFPRHSLDLLPDDEYEATFERVYGEKPKRHRAAVFFLNYIKLPLIETSWLKTPFVFKADRFSFELSNDQLKIIKGPCRSTQDAVVCHIIKALAKVAPRPTASISLVYDPRTMVGLPSNFAAGCGWLDVVAHLDDVIHRSLPDLAADLRSQLDHVKTVVAKDLLALQLTAFRRGEGFDAWLRMHQGLTPKDADIRFAVNNQSKRSLPRLPGFQSPATACFCENPFCWLPTSNGVVLHFPLDAVKPCLKDPETRATVLNAIHDLSSLDDSSRWHPPTTR